MTKQKLKFQLDFTKGGFNPLTVASCNEWLTLLELEIISVDELEHYMSSVPIM